MRELVQGLFVCIEFKVKWVEQWDYLSVTSKGQKMEK